MKTINSEMLAEAESMLKELKHERLLVVLIPAPEPQFVGHMIRYVTNENPNWYKKIFEERGYIHRHRIVNTLQKIIDGKYNKNNAYFNEIIEAIIQTIEEYKYYEKEDQENS